MSPAVVDKQMHEDKPICRLCRGTECYSVGSPAYRKPPRVAGVNIDVEDLNLVLFRCGDCGYHFVHPLIPEARLNKCYRNSHIQWKTGSSVVGTRSYELKRDLLLDYGPSGRRLLDVGCFDGGFEEFLNGDYVCSGVEPSSVAAQLARNRGVDILAASLDQLKDLDLEFDVVVMFDVAEHLTDPVKEFLQLKKMLPKDGIILFETGDMDSFPWQDLMTINPYCALYEHVGFFNYTSVNTLARILSMDLVYFERSTHSKISSMERFKRLFKRRLYWLFRALHNFKGPLGHRLRRIALGPLPGPPVQRDHFIAILKKNNE